MNDLSLFDERKMTVRDVAEVLGYQPDTIQKMAKALELVGTIGRIEVRADSSHALLLSKDQVQAIKDALVPRTSALKSGVENATTDIDMKRKTAEVLAWLVSENNRKDEKIAIDAPKVESFDALQKSDNSMSITQAAKYFGENPKTLVFPYLRAHGYLTQKDLPAQAALDAGYLVMREARCPDGIFRPQARVLDCQLETWRTRVIPQIQAWAVS